LARGKVPFEGVRRRKKVPHAKKKSVARAARDETLERAFDRVM
jgi:hypothetical protein